MIKTANSNRKWFGIAMVVGVALATLDCKSESCDAPKTEIPQGIYVVSAQANDGYCGDARFPNSHANALQACIDRASAAGGGIVLVRAGTYVTGKWAFQLRSNVRIESEDAPQ